ncbi:MAG: PASTA domain-containing protein [Spirochaetaceae bacterium]|jgi:beta-lactam-binding protein with PASTA domain|nr:PASTA domain-containing protein [Spirochaetaceae bacterium]
MAFVSIIAATSFFAALRGTEQTMVPEVRGKDLIEALLELQQKELYPRIDLRYSVSAADKGRILEQSPRAGSIVKAGRRIRLVVSQGMVLSVVEDYVGRNVDDVRIELQTLFASNPQPLLTLKEPFLYQYSGKPAGTILEQAPVPGVNIFSPVELEFVISRGEEEETVKMPALVGLGIADTMKEIGEAGIRFNFSIRLGQGRSSAETVIAQTPAAGVSMKGDAVAEITVAAPTQGDLEENEVFSLFRHRLPDNPYPLPATLEAILPGGERKTLVSLDHPGGDFSFPYRLPEGSVLVLSVLNREMYRETVP